jgi:hypothetical protein
MIDRDYFALKCTCFFIIWEISCLSSDYRNDDPNIIVKVLVYVIYACLVYKVILDLDTALHIYVDKMYPPELPV